MYKLRELSRDDILVINKWRNNIELISYLGAAFRYINPEVDGKWFEHYMQNRNTTIRCVIVDSSNENNIYGLVSLTGIDSLNQTGEFHIMIGESTNRGKGIGFFATKEMIKHGFYNMNLNRIELSVLESNVLAVNLYEKIGFKKEGIKRQSVYKNGEFLNMITMAILKEEFK